MPKSKLVQAMISCDKAVLICNKSQYKEATFYEKIKLKLHLLFCHSCKVFSRKNKLLTALFDGVKLSQLSDQDKKVLREKIEALL
jgi:hypothetical protein